MTVNQITLEVVMDTGETIKLTTPIQSTAIAPETLASLTERETEVLAMIAAGLTIKEMAEAITVTESTMKTHIAHTLHKLQTPNSRTAATLALLTGTITQNQVTQLWAKHRPHLLAPKPPKERTPAQPR